MNRSQPGDDSPEESRPRRARRRFVQSARLVALALWDSSSAFVFVFRHGLVVHVLVVFLVALVAFVGLWIAGWHLSGVITDAILARLPVARLAEAWQVSPERLQTVCYWIGHLLIGLPLKFFFLLFHMPLVQAIGFPIFDRLSEDVDAALEGRAAVRHFEWRRYVVMLATVGLPNLLMNLVRSGFFYLLSILPIIGVVFFARGFLINAYYSGYGILENYFENRGLDPSRSRQAIRARRELAIGVGLFANLIGLVPLLGTSLGATLGIVGGGIALHRAEQRARKPAPTSPVSAAPC